jgi:uncharacterized protein YukJ
MPLPSYGLLIGRVVASRPQRRGSPHWLLMVQPGDARHPPYRVAVNLQSTEAGEPPAIEYQVVDFSRRGTRAGKALVEKLVAMKTTPSFLVADSEPSLPRLDFVRDDILDVDRFVDLPAGSNPLRNRFEQTLNAEARVGRNGGPLVAVFGTGYPIDPHSGRAVPTGFTGIENIHMNQGAMNLVNGATHYLENGPNQDGALIFLLASGEARGFFVKFHTQTAQTDTNGNPTVTGIPKLDSTSPAIRRAIMPRIPTVARTTIQRRAPDRAMRIASARVAAARVAGAPAGAVAAAIAAQPGAPTGYGNYVFADVDPADASGVYIPDDDTGTYQTPYVMTRSLGHTRGPVPAPRGYPRMDLAIVVGSSPPGYSNSRSGESIAFDVVGDSGAPSQQSLDAFEVKVTDLMATNAQASPPAFLFHVGDVVYFYGEENYYYSQFYDPFRAYPAPIFAIPGNHDGITYNDSMVSLAPFQQAFCAAQPGRWSGAGGIRRSTMTQPGVYFTLDAPLVSIIGLYSNCGESFGWLDEQQLLFLYQELTRLKQARKGGLPAVILAIHHFPRWFPTETPADPNSTAIDAACKKAGFWPDAVICGHAHLYQRVVRQDASIGKDIPYVMAGAGGYGLNPEQEVGKPYMQKIAPSGTRLSRVLIESGYARATVTAPASGDPTLQFQYYSVKQTSNEPDDACVVNLRTGSLA